jgi:hypothetical protein
VLRFRAGTLTLAMCRAVCDGNPTGENPMSAKPWRFVEVSGGTWRWQCGDPEHTVTSKNTFPDLASCILDAEANGFQAKRERRRRARNTPGSEMRCVGGS